MSFFLKRTVFLLGILCFLAYGYEFNSVFDNEREVSEWIPWISLPDSGTIVHDAETGCNAPGAVLFKHVGRAALTKNITFDAADSLMKLSFKYKDSGSENRGLVMVDVRIAGQFENIVLHSLPFVPSEKWNECEIYFQLPENIGRERNARIDLLVQNAFNNVWIDDVVLQNNSVSALWNADFATSDEIEKWQSYAPMGLIEGVTEIKYSTDKYADNGSVVVNHVSGQSGYGATLKDPIKLEAFNGEQYLTLSAYAKGTNDAKAQIGVEQFDANGKIIDYKIMKDAIAFGREFKYISLAFKVLPDAVSLRPVLINQENGHVIFDNVAFRPANIAEKTAVDAEQNKPLWAIVYPADFFAFIDHRESDLRLTAGRAGCFIVMLAGDKSIEGDTYVEFSLPESVEVLTCQWSTYGKQPLPVEDLKSDKAGVRTYRIKNPYDWKSAMMKGNPNHYMGLEVVVRAPEQTGNIGALEYKLSVGDRQGEVRSMPVMVLPAPAVVPAMEGFRVGGASLLTNNVVDEKAREALISDHLKYGVSIGLIHDNQAETAGTSERLGMGLRYNIQSPHIASVYRGVYAKELPPVILNDGRPLKSEVSFAVVLNSPELREAYKKYIRKCIAVLPKSGFRQLALDIEFWGTGLCSRSDFSPATLGEFRKFASIPEDEELTYSTIFGKHLEKWYAYRNDVTVRLYRMTRDIIREIDPDVRLVDYGYSLEKDTGRSRSIYRMDVPTDIQAYDAKDAVDEHGVSTYNIEGVNFLDHISCDAGNLSKPVYAEPYIAEALPAVKNPNWAYHHLSANEVRMEILGAAASGAKGVTFFSGVAYDGERLCAIAEGMNAVAKYEKFYMKGRRCDNNIKVTGLDDEMRYRAHLYGRELLLTVFNYGRQPRAVTFHDQTFTVQPNDYSQVIIEIPEK